MKKVVLIIAFLLVLTYSAFAVECGNVPTDSCTVTQDTTFDYGTYDLPNGIIINGEGITLNCNSATSLGNSSKYGINVYGSKNIIENCILDEYDSGAIILWGGDKHQIINNTIKNSDYAIYINLGYLEEVTIKNNNFFNDNYYVYDTRSNDINLSVEGNYFGISDEIKSKFYTSHNGSIIYEPYLCESWPTDKFSPCALNDNKTQTEYYSKEEIDEMLAEKEKKIQELKEGMGIIKGMFDKSKIYLSFVPESLRKQMVCKALKLSNEVVFEDLGLHCELGEDRTECNCNVL